MQVKREIGVIWANTDSSPYMDLFNDTTTGAQVWRSVLVMRAVDEELQKLRASDLARADMVAIHLNRIVLFLVFQDPKVQQWRSGPMTDADLVKIAREITGPMFRMVSAYIATHHPADYLASLSKNQSKCEVMADRLLHPEKEQAASPQPDLFT